MPALPLRRLHLGSARDLTRDCLCGVYFEIQALWSRYPDG